MNDTESGHVRSPREITEELRGMQSGDQTCHKRKPTQSLRVLYLNRSASVCRVRVVGFRDSRL